MIYRDFHEAIHGSIARLKQYGEDVDTGHWQGVKTEGKPDLVTKEILNLAFTVPIPQNRVHAVSQILPNLPWAEDHFKERVSRVPSNPGEEYKNWPWWRGQDASTAADPRDRGVSFKFTHTYQERFWPRWADPGTSPPGEMEPNRGIRYTYGDLDDVVGLLRREPHTRQAYLPIFFPEDTGAVHGGRIPCTLGYQFLLRNSRLHMWYHLRSCDAVRHFRDDLYLAVRLAQWVLAEVKKREWHEQEGEEDTPGTWEGVELGRLYFTAYSFHVHRGDYHLL